MLNSMQEGSGRSEESDGFRPKPSDKAYSIFKMTGPASHCSSDFWKAPPALVRRLCQKFTTARLAYESSIQKSESSRPLLLSIKLKGQFHVINSVMSVLVHIKVFILRIISLFGNDHIQPVYSIFLHNRCNFHHKEIEKKILIAQFCPFSTEKKPSTFYF